MSRQPSNALIRSIRTVNDFPSEGIQFKDITPLLADVSLVAEAILLLADPFREAGITKVAAIESRGFILGAMVAEALGVGFVPVRKKGKLPFTTVCETYELEYGTDSIEIHVDALDSTDVVLIHDDVIATGGTAAATGRLIERCGATVAGFSFLIELAVLAGCKKLPPQVPCRSVVVFDK
jgi:adenine phosphoribosyltransferase